MTRFFFLTLFLLACPLTASAAQAPSGQAALAPGQVLRGSFVQESRMKGFNNPLQSSGHFVVAPGHGLIWNIEKPFATSTIVTPRGSIQDLGGLSVKLPIKNLRHLYDMIGGALAGDWSGLEGEYAITQSGNQAQWQMLLTPRHRTKSTLPYASITVSGGRFVENIAMMKPDGSSDRVSFADEALSTAPLAANESAAFVKAGK